MGTSSCNHQQWPGTKFHQLNSSVHTRKDESFYWHFVYMKKVIQGEWFVLTSRLQVKRRAERRKGISDGINHKEIFLWLLLLLLLFDQILYGLLIKVLIGPQCLKVCEKKSLEDRLKMFQLEKCIFYWKRDTTFLEWKSIMYFDVIVKVNLYLQLDCL